MAPPHVLSSLPPVADTAHPTLLSPLHPAGLSFTRGSPAACSGRVSPTFQPRDARVLIVEASPFSSLIQEGTQMSESDFVVWLASQAFILCKRITFTSFSI